MGVQFPGTSVALRNVY